VIHRYDATKQWSGIYHFAQTLIPCWNSSVMYQPGVTMLQVNKKKCSVEEWEESIIVPIYKNGDKTE